MLLRSTKASSCFVAAPACPHAEFAPDPQNEASGAEDQEEYNQVYGLPQGALAPPCVIALSLLPRHLFSPALQQKRPRALRPEACVIALRPECGGRLGVSR